MEVKLPLTLDEQTLIACELNPVLHREVCDKLFAAQNVMEEIRQWSKRVIAGKEDPRIFARFCINLINSVIPPENT